AVEYTLPATVTPTVAIDRNGRLGYKPDWSDGSTTWSPQGTAGLMFPNSKDEYAPAIKWQYDRLCGPEGDQHWDTDRAGGMYSILYYPEDTEAQDPADVWGLNYVDPAHGMVMFRNAYQDSDDVVAMHNAKQRRPWQTHAGPDLNSFRVIGLNTVWVTGDGRYYTNADPRGQTAMFPADPETWDYHDSSTGELVDHFFAPDGSGYSVIDGSSVGTEDHRRRFIADYNEATGAEAVFIVADTSSNGEFWRLSTGGMNNVATSDDGFEISSPDGHKLIATILHAGEDGEGYYVSTDTWERHWEFNYEGEVFDSNKCIDLKAVEGDLLVVLSLVREGQSAPTVSSEGDGVFRTVNVGDQTYWISSDGIEIEHVVPEPATMTMLSISAGLLLIHRRRRGDG
ncbi:MAG: PEP-CTERM sorting domain-containing protein, partial [Planctomycetota bacterium]